MRLQEQKIVEIEAARKAAFQAARATSSERLDWRPMGVGQSVFSMARELAKTPDWAYYVLTGATPDEPNEASAAQRNEMEAWRTLDECESACRAKLTRLFAFYRGLTDEELARTIWLPFNGGRDHTMAELLDYPRWNFAYHLGQIEYIQSLDGRKRATCIFSSLRR